MKKFICIAVLAASAPFASAFSLLGDFETWQTAAIGYDPFGPDIGAPKNLGEEYRWNTPIITYGYDIPFLNYFGTPGVQAIERAIAILNSLPPVSTLSQELNEFPLTDEDGNQTQFMDSRRLNPEAQALQIVDIKSVALGLLVEELGLANPERWVWALRDRKTFTNPDETNYLTIMRNFDPVTYEPSYFVNGVRYTYSVLEFQNPNFADAIEEPVDLNLLPYKSVAGISGGLGNATGLDFGIYYTALTRDDIGGLRYIYHPNNINVEPFPPGTQIFLPDRTNFLSLTNQDLTLLSLLSLTASPQQISNFFPGIIVTNATPAGRVTRVDLEVTTNTITIGLLTNRSQLLLITNTDLAAFSSLTRTSEPAALTALGLDILATNLLGLTTQVDIASIALTNIGAPLFTNFNNLTIVTNQDLYLFSKISLTSSPPVLLAQYPGLFITATNPSVRTVVEPLNTYLTNAPRQPWEVPGTQTNFILATNFVTNLQTIYNYSYGNVITNYVSPVTTVRQFETGFEKEPWSVPNNPVYKTTSNEVTTAEISGAFTIVPPNIAGYVFTGFNTTNHFFQTNIILRTTMFDPISGLFRLVAREDITTFTNVQYAAYPIEIVGPGQQVLMTNFVTNIVRLFDYRFRNVITNFVFNPSLVTVQDLTIQQDLFRPNFPPVTNFVSRTFLSNFVSGGAVIFPTNLFGLEFTGLAITNIVPVTNLLINAANPLTGTTFQQVAIYNYTNIIYGVYPIEFLPQGFVTNILTTNLVVREVDTFDFEFANVITNPPPFTFPSGSPVSPTTLVTNYVFQIVPDPFSPTGLRTNLIQGPIVETIPVPSGGFIIDTNLTGFEFSGLATTNIITVTNQIGSITDPTVFTNVVHRFTNIVYGVFPFVLQPAPATALRPGVDKLTFVRVGGTNLLEVDFTHTKRFKASYITNGFLATSTFVISNTQPDILFSAADLGVFNDTVAPVQFVRSANWVNNGALNTQTPNPNPTDQGGPGNIFPRVVISFNKIGPSIINFFPGGITEEDANTLLGVRPFVWGAFDGSTNPPIVFPEDITLEQLEFKILNQLP